MRITVRFLGAAAIVVLFLGSTFLFINRAYADSPLPGINVEDKYGNGCVDCHVDEGGNDRRISVVLKSFPEHPDVGVIMNTLPDDCYMCHKVGGAEAPINQITHKQHFENPGDNEFITKYEGTCLACHTVDLNTGKVTAKSGPKNW